jgi:hypothetical protein
LNFELRPTFKEEVHAAEKPVRRAALKMLEQIMGLPDLSKLFGHRGLHFEKIQGMTDPESREQIYSLRVTRGVRALAFLKDGPSLVLVGLHIQHDRAYRRR